MAYQQVREILETVRHFHRYFRREIEASYSTTQDPRSQFLLRSIRRGEQEMDLALGKYRKDGDQAVLDTWIQFVPSEEIQEVLFKKKIPDHSTPSEVLEWKREFDASLVEFYRNIARQVSAPRTQELFESLATMTDQRLTDQSWQAREDELAPNNNNP
ncbi:MAG: hypothetical protein KDA84_16745 [Planctomycetaceae bacterium]|nr:hypothetical protein [Planctomycetaceae bacterium]